jgi:hypothetical protein
MFRLYSSMFYFDPYNTLVFVESDHVPALDSWREMQRKYVESSEVGELGSSRSSGNYALHIL